ncbi:hypothetical protein [Methylomonas rosea]|uniref:Alpha/beta hydrolase n=1 Tax=Methylomonas rosea TaxID=2952227 RepID=A0ABT1TV93_9GAMM|nr:hypothetical protein [Methylomonas sp. WSC-7]MCQ8117993.1 hypothetical protein [Methylomonas sp. WSC-7]
MDTRLKPENNQALVILLGITADAACKSHVLDYYRRHSHFRVFLPNHCQYFGIDFAAGQLCHFLDKHDLREFERCHFICYISGGFILRRALADSPLPNLGRVVYVRSPLQERVPRLSLRRYGPLPLLKFGKILLDLAGDRKDRLPELRTDCGYVLESGVSAQAAELGLTADDFARCREDSRFAIPSDMPILTTPLSHDQVYSDDTLLAQMLAFIESGSFQHA